MNKSKYYRPDRLHLIGFLVCAALFALGCVAGAVASGALPPDTPMSEYIASLARADNPGFGGRFLSALCTSGKFHALVLFFAFSALGIAAIPAVSALRGFLLCFAVTSVIRCYGASGVPYALLMFAPEALISVPGLLLLSTHSMLSSATLLRACMPHTGGQTTALGMVFVRRVALSTAFLCVSALIDAAAAPWLAKYFLG